MKKRVKTVYYYAIKIEDLKFGTDDTENAYTIITNIINSHGNSGSLSLTQGDKIITMDIIDNNAKFLFAKVGKIKPSAEMQLRNYITLARKDVISHEDRGEVGVEICTHFLLDYQTGIVGFVFGQSAPSSTVLVNIVNTYSLQHTMSISNIVSEDSVQTLLTPGSQIKKISYKYLVPDVRVLEYINLPEKLVAKLLSNEELEIELTIKEKGRIPLLIGLDNISEAIDSLKGKIVKKEISNVKLNGKTTNSLSRDYKFIEQQLNAKVEISYEVDEYNQIIEDSDNVDSQFYNKLLKEYEDNKNLLILLANKD